MLYAIETSMSQSCAQTWIKGITVKSFKEPTELDDCCRSLPTVTTLFRVMNYYYFKIK